MHSRSKRSVRLRALAAGLCLLAYLQAAGFGPFLLGLAASAEGSHTVSVSCESDHVSVILHHQESVRADVHHRHGMASRIICLSGRSGPTPLSDHVVSFASAPAYESKSGEVKVCRGEPLCLVCIGPLQEPRSSHLPSFNPGGLALPTSVESGSLVALRTTVLRI